MGRAGAARGRAFRDGAGAGRELPRGRGGGRGVDDVAADAMPSSRADARGRRGRAGPRAQGGGTGRGGRCGAARPRPRAPAARCCRRAYGPGLPIAFSAVGDGDRRAAAARRAQRSVYTRGRVATLPSASTELRSRGRHLKRRQSRARRLRLELRSVRLPDILPPTLRGGGSMRIFRSKMLVAPLAAVAVLCRCGCCERCEEQPPQGDAASPRRDARAARPAGARPRERSPSTPCRPTRRCGASSRRSRSAGASGDVDEVRHGRAAGPVRCRGDCGQPRAPT